MRTILPCKILHCCVLVACIFCLSTITNSAETPAYVGWEKGSQYNGFYNYKERDSLKGEILEFKEITPLPGMAPGTAFILKEGDDKILVHLCPVAFRTPEATGIRRGVKTKVSGCWTLIDGQDIFIAAKVKQGENFEFKVRLTKDGTPFWTLTPEELAKETAPN